MTREHHGDTLKRAAGDAPTFRFERHPRDRGIDEILVVREQPTSPEHARETAVIKIAPFERYKTSGLSGNEWRFSWGLFVRPIGTNEWLHGESAGNMQAACAMAYPCLFGDFTDGKWGKEFYTQKVAGIAFHWKGHPIYFAHHAGNAADLLVTLGHLPWSLCLAGDQGSDPGPLDRLCCQPGCSEPHVSVFALVKDFNDWGEERLWPSWQKAVSVRAFCQKHLRRGDCGLSDSDRNYRLLSGVGPDGNEPDPAVVKQAILAQPIQIDLDDNV